MKLQDAQAHNLDWILIGCEYVGIHEWYRILPPQVGHKEWNIGTITSMLLFDVIGSPEMFWDSIS